MCDKSLCLLFILSSGIRAFFHKEGSKGKKIYRLFLKGAFNSVKANPTISAVGNFLVSLTVIRE